MIELFVIGENNMVDLNKVWISTIPEFRALLARDKGGPGDGSGKYKKQARREFTYIYHMYDFRSPYENFKPKEREEEALRCSELTRGKVQSDGALWDAIKVYEQLMANCALSLQTYRKLKATVTNLENYLENVDLNDRTDNGAKVHSIKEVQDAVRNQAATIESLTKLENAIKQEMKGESGMRGDATKGYDEDPDEEDTY